jgi:hypothetical protein
MVRIVLHLLNDDPILGDVDQLPSPVDTNICIKHPSRRDGKDVPYLDGSISSVIFPIHRVSFIEVVTVESEEEIISHFREK